MSTLTRFAASIPGAIIITTGLGLTMANLIKVSFTPEPKVEIAAFEINPMVEDLPVTPKELDIKKYVKVETPPAPPILTRDPAAKPAEPIATIGEAIPIFDTPPIGHTVINIAITDRDAKPLVRIKPVMPLRAQKSGHCKVRFDVSPSGQPYNIAITYCSQNLFKRATVKSVERWKYQPKIQSGVPVSRSGVESKITFALNDDDGRPIPE